MKKLTFHKLFAILVVSLLLITFLPAKSQAQTWFNTSWSFRKAITIDYNKVSTGPHTNFPVLINITDGNLATGALANGNDILFTSSDGKTKLNHEIESYTSTTGALVAWVTIPSLSSSSNTLIYMYYGNAAAASQQNVTGTWDATFQGVYHLNNSFFDATSNRFDGINTGTTNVTGKISNGSGFDPSNGADYITIRGKMGSPPSITLSVWAKLGTLDANGAEMISIGDNVIARFTSTGTEAYFYYGTAWTKLTSNTAISTGAWHYITCTSAGNTQKLYIDGAQIAFTTTAVAITYAGLGIDTYIGVHANGSTLFDFDGSMDEVRISNSARSLGWILTEFNNQNSPATFYNIGVQTCSLLLAAVSSNLLSYYKFEGNANDATNNNNGTLQGPPTPAPDRFGIANKAYNFNGSSQYVSTANSYTNPLSYSTSIWFKTTTNTGGYLIGFGNAGTGSSYTLDRIMYMANSGQIYFELYNTGVHTINSVSSYNDGNWHQATATFSTTTGMTLYIDALKVAADAAVTTGISYTGFWRIGYENISAYWGTTVSSNYFNGVLDDAFIYSNALTAAEVTKLYTAPDGVGNSGPVCAGSPISFNAPAINGAAYSWTGPNSFASTLQNPSFTYSAAYPGVYTLSVTAQGCTGTTSTNVISNSTSGQWTGNVSTDWSAANNWCNGVVPTSSTDVILSLPVTNMPSVTGSVFCKNLTINAGITLTTSILGTLNIAGNVANNGTMTNNGTTNFNGTTGQQTFTGITSFNHLTINNTAGLLPGGDFIVTGNLTINSGTLNNNNKNITIGGNWINNGTFIPGTGTVIFNGPTSLISGTTNTNTFNNLSVAASSSITASTGITGLIVNGTLTTGSSSVLDLGTTAILSGTLGIVNNTGTIKTAIPTSTSILPIPTGKTWGGTIDFYNINGQTVPAGTYNNLTVRPGGGQTTWAGGNLTVNGALNSMTSGCYFDFTNYILSGALTSIYNNGWLRTSVPSATSIIPIPSGKNWGTSGGIEFYAAAGLQTVVAGTYWILSSSNTGGTNTAGGDLTIGSQLLTTAGGTLDMGSTYRITNGALFTNNGTVKTSVATNPFPNNQTWGGSGTVEYAAAGGGQYVMAGTYNNLKLNNTSGTNNTIYGSVTLNGILTLSGGTVTTNAFFITLNSTATLTRPAGGHVIGILKKYVPAGAPVITFEIGDAINYTPATVSIENVTTPDFLKASVTATDHPGLSGSGILTSRSVNRYWTFALTATPFVFTTAAITMNWIAGDVDAGATTANFKVGKYNNPTWVLPSVTSPLATSIQATGVTSFAGDFIVGEPCTLSTAFSYSGSPYCTATGTASATITGISGIFTSAAGLTIDPSTGTVNLATSTPGSYTVTNTASSTGGCSSVSTAGIIINQTPTVSGTSTLSCIGGTTGTITATGTGTLDPLPYSLNAGTYQASATFSGLSAGIYTLNAKSNTGCIISTSVTVVDYPTSGDNPTVTATDSWMGHVYDGITFNNYIGHYAETENFTQGFGGVATCFPVLSNAVTRTIYTETFSVKYKMTSTKKGLYVADIGSDDGGRLTVDGTKLYDYWGGYSNTNFPSVLMNLNGLSNLLYEYFDGGGGNRVAFTNLTPLLANTLTTNITQAICSGSSGLAITGDMYGTLPAGITLSGTGYQWSYATISGGEKTDIAGATGATFTPSATGVFNTPGTYFIYRKAVLSSTNNISLPVYVATNESNAAVITVKALSTLRSSATAVACSNTSNTYTATSATEPTTFSWTRALVAGISNSAGSGATATATETLINTTAAPVNVLYVYILTTNGCSNTQNVTVTVNPATTINTQPVASTICTMANTTFLVGASGTGLTYRWRENGIDLSNTGIYSGTTTATLTLTGVSSTQNNKTYSVYISGSCGSILSNTGLLTISQPPAPGVTSPVYYNLNATAVPLTASLSNLMWNTSTTSGSAGGVSTINNTVFADGGGSNKKTLFTTTSANVIITSVDYYIAANQTVTGFVLAIFNGAGAVIATSSTVTTQTAGAAAIKITNTFNFNLATAGNYSIGFSAGSGTIGSKISVFPLTEATGTINITGVSSPTFNCFYNIGFIRNPSSVAPTPATTTIGSTDYKVNQTVGCVSQDATITVIVRAIGNNSLDFTNGAHAALCKTAVENSLLTLTAPAGIVFIKVDFASYGTPEGICPSFAIGTSHAAISQSVAEAALLGNNTATISASNGVFTDPIVGVVKNLFVRATYTQPICYGTSPGIITGSTPTGGNGTSYTYSWEQSTTSLSTGYSVITGSTSKDYTPGNLTQTTWYRRTVNSAECKDVSGILKVTVVSPGTWSGAISTDWNTSGNWVCGVKPIAGTDVTIPLSALYPVLNIDTGLAKNLTIQTGATLTVSGSSLITTGGILKIAGTIANAGTFDVSAGTIEMNGSVAQTIPVLPFPSFANNNIFNLIISNNVTLNGPLNLKGALSFGATGKTLTTAGFLTLASTATGTARLADMTGNTLTGNVTIERYIPARRAWRLLSAPLKSVAAPTINTAWQEGVTSGNPSPGYGVQIVGGDAASGYDQGINRNASLKIYDLSTNVLIPLPSATGTKELITKYPGYFLFIRGNRSTNLSLGANAALTPTTLRMKGQINAGSIPVTLTGNNSKYMLFGNPYPSAINFQSLTKTNVNDKFYVWDPKLAGLYGMGGYVTLIRNGAGYDIAPTGGLGSPITATIASGEAFFVEIPDVTKPATILFKETDKTTSGSDFVFRPTKGDENLRVNLFGIYPDKSTYLIDGILTTYNDNNAGLVDDNDAVKLYNGGENISIDRDGKKLAIERRHTITDTDTTFLNLSTLGKQDYKLQITSNITQNSGFYAVIKDSYSANINNTLVNMDGVTEVIFNVNADAGSYAANRFSIVFLKQLVLPVRFVSIKAYPRQKDIIVEWKTATELNVKDYSVETAGNGMNFTKIATVTATSISGGSAIYTWPDVNVAGGIHYYRIKSTDFNGKENYSSIVKVNTGDALSGIAIYPNPVTDGTIALQLNNMPKGKYKLRLLNLTGQELLIKEIIHAGGSAAEKISLSKYLAKGIYNLEITDPENHITSTRLINQ